MLFCQPYKRQYFNHRANPGNYDKDFPITSQRAQELEEFLSMRFRILGVDPVHGLDSRYFYADTMTGPGNSGDIFVHTSHAYLLDFNVDFIFNEFYFKPAFNSLIFALQKLELSRKSDEQMVELLRAKHEFHMNFDMYRNSDTVTEFPHGTRDTADLWKKDASFLDLQHSTPYSKDTFFYNATRIHIKRKKAAIRHLVLNPLWYQEPEASVSFALRTDRHATSHASSYIQAEEVMRADNDHVSNSNFFELRRNPLDLQDLCALKLRRAVCTEVEKAYPNKSDFEHSQITGKLPPIHQSFCETLVFCSDREAKGTTFFRDCNSIEKSERDDRCEMLESQPSHTILFNSRAIVRITEYRYLRTICLFAMDRWTETNGQSVHFYEDLTDVTSFYNAGDWRPHIPLGIHIPLDNNRSFRDAINAVVHSSDDYDEN